MTTNATPVTITRSNRATVDRDLPDLTGLIDKDDSRGLKKVSADAARSAMESQDAILVRDAENRLRAASLFYDRGELADGRQLFEFGSVTAAECPGHDLLPTMSRMFTTRTIILQPDSLIIGVVRFDNEVKNHSSLHQLRKAGYMPSDSATRVLVEQTRKLDPGRELLIFDPVNACVQARLLKALVDGGLIPNKVPGRPALDPTYHLSPIDDGLLEKYIASTCTKPCRLVG